MKRKKLQAEKPTAGTVIGAKYRARCNQLTDTEREKLSEEFLKLYYASPQRLEGKSPTPADDIYALGATFYELLTGTPPFEGETTEEIRQRINYEEPEPIPLRLSNLNRENEVHPQLLNFVEDVWRKVQGSDQKLPS